MKGEYLSHHTKFHNDAFVQKPVLKMSRVVIKFAHKTMKIFISPQQTHQSITVPTHLPTKNVNLVFCEQDIFVSTIGPIL